MAARLNPYRAQVAAVLDAVVVDGPDRYRWRGRRARAPLAPDAAEQRFNLLHVLRNELYLSFYVRGRVVDARLGTREPAAVGDAGFATRIASAFAGRGGFDGGWTLERLDGDEAILTDGGLRMRAPQSACRPDGGRWAAGAAVSVAVPAEPSLLSPGFLTMLGDAGTGDGDVVRVYWSVSGAGAPVLVRELTTLLNAARVPFRLKVADRPSRFDRCDAATLYLPLGEFAALRPRLEALAVRSRRWLYPERPALTLELSPGVGLAEAAGAGESYGERRCRLLAEGIVEAHERDAGGPAERLAAVGARFARDGVDLDAPYREPAFAGHHVL